MSYIVPPVTTILRPVVVTSTIAPQSAQNAISDIRTNPQQTQGWTGIKFPFRFSAMGRVAISTTNSYGNIDHIKEAIEQICLTRIRSRFFNPTFGTVFVDAVFEPITEVQQAFENTLLIALRKQETRCSFVSLSVVTNYQANSVSVLMTYSITQLLPGVVIQQIVTVSQ